MASLSVSACATAILLCFTQASPACAEARSSNEKKQNSATKVSPKQPASEELLQQAINNAGNDRAALVRNLEAFLKEFPDSPQRPQIYRALVEASLQLRDNARASNYAERLVALSPDDISMTILTIQLRDSPKLDSRGTTGRNCRNEKRFQRRDRAVRPRFRPCRHNNGNFQPP